MAKWNPISALWDSSPFSHFTFLIVSSTTIHFVFTFNCPSGMSFRRLRRVRDMGECRLDSWYWPLSPCLPPFCYSHIQCSASWASWLLQATPQPWKPALVTEELDSVLVSVCVLLIYLQDLPIATCSFLLMILKLAVLEKCFALGILNLGRPFGMCENANGFPVPTCIDLRRQKELHI